MAYFGFFADPQLTTPLTSLSMVVNAQTGGTKDFVLYFGSPDSTVKAVPDPQGNNPNEIQVYLRDLITGNGHDIGTEVIYRLATTQAGLDTATDNTPLSLGTQVLGGTANAIEIWLRLIENPQPNPGNFTDLELTTTDYIVQGV
ncbi:MAG: hypothetical protein DSY42_04885 [Aquifex sp.]|nr:MAG: hypothetical protein DSY42_04885 [Aquifex sp.]